MTELNIPKGVNSTILALVPKKVDSMEMKDFRLIACCNVLYKVVSKILANRLKQILPRVITENQSAFIKGRLLMENVLLASELVKDYHKDTVSPRYSRGYGVPGKFIHWIKLCISTPSFSVQIDKVMRENRFNLHPKCKALSLTHLCFADDLMVFVEGTKKSIEGALTVFGDFAKWSGLNISIEKSTLFMAGVTDVERSSILRNFPFAEGKLLVRYLGLPLMTKVMCKQDYVLLVENVRRNISSWTCRFLTYAGRLQLITAVIMSIVNFWAGAFRLPSKCIKEIEQLCSSFLWSGPALGSTRAKVAWIDLSKPKSEGGLGIRRLKEVNKVYGLKLIWRLLSGCSLWGKWIKVYLLKKKNFWEVNFKSHVGFWMWRKILKMREVAKMFYHKEVGNGRHTSFWFDKWLSKGTLFDILGDRGFIDMGVRKEATLEEAIMCLRRRRKHRSTVINEIEAELRLIKLKLIDSTEDVDMWKVETRNHLFFDCTYSAQLWESLTLGILRSDFSKDWATIIALLTDNSRGRKSTFCVRYSFQAAVYAIWRERNRVKHGEKLTAIVILLKLVDKMIRNKLSLVRMEKSGRVVFREDGISAKPGSDAMALSEHIEMTDNDEEGEEEKEASSASSSDESVSSDYDEESPQGICVLERMGLGASGQRILVKVVLPKLSMDHALEHIKNGKDKFEKQKKKKKRSRVGKRKREKKFVKAV
ncbi:uncharacterized protein LOC108845088 [Raphanus sativus]|uniref:Uncharacterized protein LOC108845088 n=1 Tax=Raphanus sativus TaxID=3726 RepID=A0A9W3DEI4_RAPSA|nr:uncharacterized protein LOC108845088 [Raphanus sativus]